MLALLIGCEVEVSGRLLDPDGTPVAGAHVEATAGSCAAVTDAQGQFRARCPRAEYDFVVSHPSHAAGTLRIDASGAFSPPPASTTLAPWPDAPGLYIEPQYTPLASVGLVRAASATEERFCLPAGVVLPAASAAVQLFDVHAVDWRAYAVDAEGCALRLVVEGGGRFWSPRAERVEPVSVTELAPGRSRAAFSLVPGRYVVAPWYEGFLVPEDPKADTWAAWAFEVPAG